MIKNYRQHLIRKKAIKLTNNALDVLYIGKLLPPDTNTKALAKICVRGALRKHNQTIAPGNYKAPHELSITIAALCFYLNQLTNAVYREQCDKQVNKRNLWCGLPETLETQIVKLTKAHKEDYQLCLSDKEILGWCSVILSNTLLLNKALVQEDHPSNTKLLMLINNTKELSSLQAGGA
ncbi:hypothetical protein [Vibrio barjaei]|uniref:hypothetical protein n=1 Tax=Vibrio barjaei TaxID=1676683 RepID=UPI002284DF03|nr:hypothetical protein [Vibrio barjaei]MCY9870371.1 hypothetical protein [Vibrio barjaei]